MIRPIRLEIMIERLHTERRAFRNKEFQTQTGLPFPSTPI